MRDAFREMRRFFMSAHDGIAVAPERLTPMFSLSSREAGLLSALCAAPDLGKSAAALGISVRTARAHLKAIFAETGTHKQSELLALAASFVRELSVHFMRQGNAWPGLPPGPGTD